MSTESPDFDRLTEAREIAAEAKADRARIRSLELENWQLKGTLGYSVPGHIPQGPFKCGLCEAKAVEINEIKQARAAEVPKHILERVINLIDDRDPFGDYCSANDLEALRDCCLRASAQEPEPWKVRYEAAIGHQMRVDAENKVLRKLVQCLINEDPNELAADGGITVLDVWRKDAERALAVRP